MHLTFYFVYGLSVEKWWLASHLNIKKAILSPFEQVPILKPWLL